MQIAALCPECGAPVEVPTGADRVRCPWCASELALAGGLRGRSPLVAIRCPDCGQSSQYPEDDWVHRCAYCAREHLVAAPGRILRFFVPPSIDAAGAARQYLDNFPGAHNPGASRLIFVPYWRWRGLLYFWQEMKVKRVRADIPAEPSVSIHRHPTREVTETVRELNSRPFDRTLAASELGIPMPTLGGRFAGLNQDPFDPPRMRGWGEVAEPSVGPDMALERLAEGALLAARKPSLESSHGSVVGGRLTLVWHPFWVLATASGEAAVDGTGAGVVGGLAAKPSAPAVRIPEAGEVRLVRSRCPICGADLPSERFQTVFFCAPCQAAWKMAGGRLERQPHRTILPADEHGAPGADVLHLPLWRLRVELETKQGRLRGRKDFRAFVPDWSYGPAQEDPAIPFYIHVPGWGNRLTPGIGAVARRYTRAQPDPAAGGAFKRVVRVLFGPKEADELALTVLLSVVHAAGEAPSGLLSSRLSVEEAELLLLPCRRSPAGQWTDLASGTAFMDSELTERRAWAP